MKMTANNSAIDEYMFLREEIMHHKKRQNTFTAFSYTTIVALWGYAIERENPWITIIALVLALPTSFRVFESRQAISQLSAYMQFYLEPVTGFRWETLLFKYRSMNHTKSKEKILYFVSKWDFIFLTVASITLFWIMVVIYKKNLEPLVFHIVIFVDIFMFLAEIAVTFYCFDYERLILSKKKKWQQVFEAHTKSKNLEKVFVLEYKCCDCKYWYPYKSDKTVGRCFYRDFIHEQEGNSFTCDKFDFRKEKMMYLSDEEFMPKQ